MHRFIITDELADIVAHQFAVQLADRFADFVTDRFTDFIADQFADIVEFERFVLHGASQIVGHQLQNCAGKLRFFNACSSSLELCR